MISVTAIHLDLGTLKQIRTAKQNRSKAICAQSRDTILRGGRHVVLLENGTESLSWSVDTDPNLVFCS